MTTYTTFVTFGQKYRHETHPIDERAHPDGWFEYISDDSQRAHAAPYTHLRPAGGALALFSHTYSPLAFLDGREWYPRGCLARFKVTQDGIEEVPS